MTILYITLAILGIGLIIFIHEAGHFLAAKKVGVRVERFALGFDPAIRGRRLRFFSFRRGETEYVLAMIPFGGYVKMAGEILPDGDHEPAEDELLAKSVGARALVFVAGAAMNILSAFIFFMIAFTIGVPFTEAKIGMVLPGGSAWEQGVRSGDSVLEINGKRPFDYYELAMASALSTEGDVLEFKLGRPVSPADPGTAERKIEVRVTPRWSTSGMYQIGVGPAVSPVFHAAPPQGSPAHEAGLRKGDRIVGAELAGVELESLSSPELVRAVSEWLEMGRPLRLKVLRDSQPLWIRLEPERDPDAKPVRQVQIRVSRSGTVVKAVAPGSEAAAFLEPGDRVLAIDRQAVATNDWFSLLGGPAGEELDLEVESAAGERRFVKIGRKDLLGWNLRGEIFWTRYGARVGSLTENSPLRSAGVEEGDVIAGVGELPVFNEAEAEAQLTNRGLVALRILRDGSWVSVEFSTPSHDDGKTFGCTAGPSLGDRLGVRWSTFPPVVVLPGGPADRAGITTGSRIVGFAGKPIYTFEELQKALGGGAGWFGCSRGQPSADQPIEWVDAGGQRRTGTVTIGTAPFRPLGLDDCLQLETRVVQVGFLASFTLGVKRTITVAKQVFLTLRSLLRRDVSAKNLSGPVGITHVFTMAAESGWGKLIYFMAMVSVNLGLLNLLPFPILDGGHLLFLGVEKIKGSPVSAKVQELATTVAFFLIITLFLFVTFHDVRRVLPW